MTEQKIELDQKKLTKIIGFRANVDFYVKVKAAADKERRSVSQLVRILVEDYIEQQKEQNNVSM